MADNTSDRGFASMDDDKQREIASKGGYAAHESGNAHEFDSEGAREAGKKGGQSRQGTGGSQASAQTEENDRGSGNKGSGTQGGTSEQHSESGKQSHKNQ